MVDITGFESSFTASGLDAEAASYAPGKFSYGRGIQGQIGVYEQPCCRQAVADKHSKAGHEEMEVGGKFYDVEMHKEATCSFQGISNEVQSHKLDEHKDTTKGAHEGVNDRREEPDHEVLPDQDGDKDPIIEDPKVEMGGNKVSKEEDPKVDTGVSKEPLEECLLAYKEVHKAQFLGDKDRLMLMSIHQGSEPTVIDHNPTEDIPASKSKLIILDVNGVVLKSWSRLLKDEWELNHAFQGIRLNNFCLVKLRLGAQDFLEALAARASVMIWSCCMKPKLMQILKTCFPKAMKKAKIIKASLKESLKFNVELKRSATFREAATISRKKDWNQQYLNKYQSVENSQESGREEEREAQPNAAQGGEYGRGVSQPYEAHANINTGCGHDAYDGRRFIIICYNCGELGDIKPLCDRPPRMGANMFPLPKNVPNRGIDYAMDIRGDQVINQENQAQVANGGHVSIVQRSSISHSSGESNIEDIVQNR
ncbi:hypothetical protein L7F22_012354 [Adiantum nelumboides]|nr:hypothetical protein [Adiantum nelumboides]